MSDNVDVNVNVNANAPNPRRVFIRAIRRPLILMAICLAFLLAHHILLRAMAHGHVAHVLLGAGNKPPDGAAALAIALVIVRFVTVILVPGLGLAAGAEIVAYLLVGPKRTQEDEEDDDDDEDAAAATALKEAAPRSQSR